MKSPNLPAKEKNVLVNPQSFALGSVGDAIVVSDDYKRFQCLPDPATVNGTLGPLCTFSHISVLAYRATGETSLFLLADFDYQTYGWVIPYSRFQLKIETTNNVILELIPLVKPIVDSPCPARVIHF